MRCPRVPGLPQNRDACGNRALKRERNHLSGDGHSDGVRWAPGQAAFQNIPAERKQVSVDLLYAGTWQRWIDTSLPAPEDIVEWQKAPASHGGTYRARARQSGLNLENTRQ